MTRRPVFWIVFSALGLAGAITAVQLFTVALPNVSLDISMDREAAISEADSLATRFGWGPEEARSAASFGQVDSQVQAYVELEGGGPDAFQSLMDAGVYQPYQWRVRRFAESEVREAEVRFAPSGAPYGFRLRLAEDDPGSGNLPPEAARQVAADGLPVWAVALESYDLIESSQETRPGGRVDHTFTYERNDLDLADARFRLRLVVGGDRLTQLTHFVFVPEAFSRRYADLRSTNDTIALVAQSVFILLYVLLGAGVGTALLLRERWVEWRTALAWGVVTSLLFGLNSINALPLSWMSYDTAVSSGTFVLQNLAAALAIVVLGGPVLGFFFLAGESLGRKAFPEHLQQWRFWSPDVAASKSALGLTIAAYLLVGLQLGYVVLFYMGTSRLEGWWSPADALVQPDLLATYFPWLQAVSISLFASLWEESIFRAVPIACAALIGAKYGRRNLWVWGAVLVQALVFAAGHANYPQQPAYARVVELYLPALGWGVVYVFFGLVPTILAHFLYDLALISSVLFASEAMADQGVIILVAAIPLAVVLWARRSGRGVDAPPEWAYNRAWKPPERAGVEAPDVTGSTSPETPPGSSALSGGGASEPPDLSPGLPALPTWAVPMVGILGVGLWVGAMSRHEAPERAEITRAEAVEVAEAELERRGFDLAEWTPSVSAGDGRSSAHEYVFDEAGSEAFDALVGSFLAPPQWIVRFVDWDAEPEQRVEEFVVNVRLDGSIRRVAHVLPESRPGESLGEENARALALAGLPAGVWDEVGAEETTHDGRTDWVFTFRDPSVLEDVAAEARASLSVIGNEVTNLRRFVDVPEEWERERREVSSRRTMVSTGLTLVLVLLFGATAVLAIVVWSRRQLHSGPFWKAAGLTFLAVTLSTVNGWPATASSFFTAQPYNFQVGAVAFSFALLAIVGAVAIGLVVALIDSWTEPGQRIAPPPYLGVAIGLALSGASNMVSVLTVGMPSAPSYNGAASFVPALAEPLGAVVPFLFLTSGVAVLAVLHHRFEGHPLLRGLTSFGIVAVAIVLVPDAAQESIVMWVLIGALAAVVVWGLTHLIGILPALAPTIFGTMVVLGLLESLLDRPYAGSVIGALLAVVVVVLLARAWSRDLAEAPQS